MSLRSGRLWWIVTPAFRASRGHNRAKTLPATRCQADGVIWAKPAGLKRASSGEDELEDEHRRDAGADQEDLPHRTSIGPAAVKPGDEIGHRDIEKTRCREGKKIGKHPWCEFEGEIRRDRAQRAG